MQVKHKIDDNIVWIKAEVDNPWAKAEAEERACSGCIFMDKYCKEHVEQLSLKGLPKCTDGGTGYIYKRVC